VTVLEQLDLDTEKVNGLCFFAIIGWTFFFQLFLVLRGVRILGGYDDPSNKNKIKNILTYFFTSQKYEYIIHHYQQTV
jgi:hypothetical protein